LLLAASSVPVFAENGEDPSSLEALAIVEQKVMVPMRDGVHLASDIYRPRNAEGPVPTIFWRTPYNFNRLDRRRAAFIQRAIRNGYAFVIQNERGKFFSEGEWEILGRPRTDGWDALDWIVEQPWSSGKVGTIGCSSSAEWQLALAAMDHPAHAAMVPQAAGAGIGRVGAFYEQGNWYRGGVFQMLFASWLYGVQNTQRPSFPSKLEREDVVRLSKYFDLAPKMPEVDWAEAIRHLPLVDIMKNVDGPKGIFAEFIKRAPDDPVWYEGGLYQDNEPWGVPALWMNSWYDVSISPNLELYGIAQRQATDAEAADNQYLVVAPTQHCAFAMASEHTVVGERDMGDARLDWDGLVFRFFDRFLADRGGALSGVPKVRYYTMGSNEWQKSETWPPAGVETRTLYLGGGGRANSLYGDGVLSFEAPSSEGVDTFAYDPALPVPSLGGGVCCTGGAVRPGSFDQRVVETRNDVLVYTSGPLAEPLEVSGPVEVTLWVSSDARDTDFTVKLVDVHPDGRAFNVDETIQRARYREGYDRQVMMEPGEVYELEVSAMVTSNTFQPGHRLRVEISSSNFPRFARNLNTGGRNWDETRGVVAHNSVHHSPSRPSQLRLSVAPR
jgi:putative CocE/NonD family hydrolase